MYIYNNKYIYIFIFPVYVHTDRRIDILYSAIAVMSLAEKQLTELKYVIERRARKNCFSLLQDCVMGII